MKLGEEVHERWFTTRKAESMEILNMKKNGAL